MTMKNKALLPMIGVLLIVTTASVFISCGGAPVAQKPAAPAAHDNHAHPQTANTKKPEIPAFQTPEQIKNLEPTLVAAQFEGKVREAYEVAKKIPETLAQLPCYCSCDKAFGHKSLHSCYVDDHASHCAVCVDEALLAYKLQKEEKLTPDQVREKIIHQYTQEQSD